MRRLWRRMVVVLSILGGLHLYIWWRLVAPLPAPWWMVATVALAALAPSLPVSMMLARGRSREAAKPILLVGYLWFGLATYLLLGAMLSHLAVELGADARPAAVLAGIAALATVALGLLHVGRG